MNSHTDVEITVLIQDVEYPCGVDFDYQCEEKSWFNEMYDNGSIGCGEEVEITRLHVQINPGLLINLLSSEYSFLGTPDLLEGVREDCINSAKKQILQEKEDYLFSNKAA